MNLADIRQEYKLASLDEKEAPANPLLLFDKWFKAALHSEVTEANAMCLSTAGDGQHPESRIVLLKEFSSSGFQFYTNYHSDKGQALAANPYCSLNFFWPELERQVRIGGKAEKVDSADSDAYFATRPRGSQVGAWVSDQSQVIEGRNVLEQRLEEQMKRFEGQEVPRPPHWGGFLVIPSHIEFWQGRPNRLHDRLLYSRVGEDGWKLERLAP